jgi:ABC-2 type transport system permease protein
MTAANPRQPPGLLASSARIFDLSLGQMLWSRRSLFLAIIACAPIALAVVIRAIVNAVGGPMNGGLPVTGAGIFGTMIWVIYIRFIVPVLGVFYGTSLIADEVDDKTITYLFTRPIPRAAVVLGKYLAYLTCTALLVLPSVVLVYLVIVPVRGGDIGRLFPALLKDLGVMVAGLSAYGALFTLAGARLKRPLVVGLVFAFGWEPGLLLFPGYLKRATVGYYLQALIPHAIPPDIVNDSPLQFFRETPTLLLSGVGLAFITAVALWWACRAVTAREYVLEQ